MTREEAAKLVHKIRMDIFKHLDTKELTAIDMAIEALSAPTDRDDMLDGGGDAEMRYEDCRPSYMQANPSEDGNDLISRQDAIDAFLTELTKRERKNLLHTWSTVEVKYFITDMMEQFPSARPTGEWIDHSGDGYVECPLCHSATNCDDNIEDLHFCFSCGAKMEVEHE